MALLTPPVGPRDHTLGTVDAPVTLVEYGDFECPFCGRAYQEVKRVLRQLKGQVRFVYWHFWLCLKSETTREGQVLGSAASCRRACRVWSGESGRASRTVST